MIKIILDTDIGTDVDDVCALALALSSPEIELAAVTTVFDNVAVRSRMAAKVLEIAGRTDVPVGIGLSQTLLRNRPLHWAGWEGDGLLGPEDADREPWVGSAVNNATGGDWSGSAAMTCVVVVCMPLLSVTVSVTV